MKNFNNNLRINRKIVRIRNSQFNILHHKINKNHPHKNNHPPAKNKSNKKSKTLMIICQSYKNKLKGMIDILNY